MNDVRIEDPVGELRIRAELLQNKIEKGDPAALKRLRALPQFAPPIRRRDCLHIVARELGFTAWAQAKSAIEAGPADGDFGTLLCPRHCAAHTNLWYRDYAEAAEMRALKNGYLLGYKRQFVVVDEHYLESLGVPADDPDWESIGRDWIKPRDPAARFRLYAKTIAQLPREGGFR